MKRPITTLLLCLVAMASFAQQKITAYCDICVYGERGITPAVISFDFGFDRNVDILGEDGKPLKFYSYVDAANYLAKYGWQITTVYSSNESLAKTHCVMCKYIEHDSDITDGLTLTKYSTAEEKRQKSKEKQAKREELAKERETSGDDMY